MVAMRPKWPTIKRKRLFIERYHEQAIIIRYFVMKVCYKYLYIYIYIFLGESSRKNGTINKNLGNMLQYPYI